MPLSTKAVLSQVDILKIRMNLTQRYEWRNLLLFELCLYTAWKATDILNMKVKHLLNSSGSVREIIQLPEGGISKTYAHYKLAVTPTIKEIFSKYVHQYPFLIKDPEAYMFFQLKSYPLGKHAISRQMLRFYMKQRCHMIGISSEYSADSLRRTWACYAYQQGMTLEQIQSRLGFASLEMTKKFLGFTSQQSNPIQHIEF